MADRRTTMSGLKSLRDQPVALKPSWDDPERRRAGVERLGNLIEQVPAMRRRSRQHRSAAVLLAAAAAVALVLAWPDGPSPPVLESLDRTHLTRAEDVTHSDQLQPGEVLRAWDSLHTLDSGHATVRYGSGARVKLSAGTQVLIAQQKPDQEAVYVSAGKVDVHVPPLSNSQSFAVRTPSALVEVVGTQFAVVFVPSTPARPAQTCVAVSEGTVNVTAGDQRRQLSAGERWSDQDGPCTRNAAPQTPDGPDAEAAISTRPTAPQVGAAKQSSPHRLPAPEEASRPSPATPLPPGPDAGAESATTATGDSAVVSPGGQLAAQNALYREAIELRRQGRPAAAVQILDQLLSRYPETPLRGAALKERSRLEKAIKPRAE